MKVRVYTDYDPIRILHGVGKDPDDVLALKVGLSGNFIEAESSEIPKDRSQRELWKHENGKIKINEEKLQEKLQKKTQTDSKRKDILEKLNISEQELKDIIKTL